MLSSDSMVRSTHAARNELLTAYSPMTSITMFAALKMMLVSINNHADI